MRFELVRQAAVCNAVAAHGAYYEGDGRLFRELGIISVNASAAVPLGILARAQVTHDVLLNIAQHLLVQSLHDIGYEGLDAYSTCLQYQARFQPKIALVGVVRKGVWKRSSSCSALMHRAEKSPELRSLDYRLDAEFGNELVDVVGAR